MIEVSGLVKSFGATRAVCGVSFEISRGEVVGLLGPNGAGKSTTMRMLTTYLEPDSGDARIVGHSVVDAPAAVRRQLGYLPESAPLYLEMTIRPYLHYMGRLRGMRRRERLTRVDEMLEVCGLYDVLDREIGQLSRGYRQRVGLAATLVHAPPFLVLDEPTTGLDPNQIVEIRKLIRRVAEERTVLFSSHILSEVEATCDRVIIIAAGCVRADGRVADVVAEAAGATVYCVSLQGDAATARSALEAEPFVRGVEVESEGDGGCRLRIVAEPDGGGPERVFHWAVENHWTLRELVEQKSSLEQTFASLTRVEEGE